MRGLEGKEETGGKLGKGFGWGKQEREGKRLRHQKLLGRLKKVHDCCRRYFHLSYVIIDITGDLLCSLFTNIHSVHNFVHYLYTIEAVHYWIYCWIRGKKTRDIGSK